MTPNLGFEISAFAYRWVWILWLICLWRIPRAPVARWPLGIFLAVSLAISAVRCWYWWQDRPINRDTRQFLSSLYSIRSTILIALSCWLLWVSRRFQSFR